MGALETKERSVARMPPPPMAISPAVMVLVDAIANVAPSAPVRVSVSTVTAASTVKVTVPEKASSTVSASVSAESAFCVVLLETISVEAAAFSLMVPSQCVGSGSVHTSTI